MDRNTTLTRPDRGRDLLATLELQGAAPRIGMLWLSQGHARQSSGRESVVWTGTGRDRNGKPCGVSLPTTISRSFPSLVSVPTIYRPVERCLVPAPSVYHPAACSLPDCFPSHCLASCSHPIPTLAHTFRRSHTLSPIPYLSTGAVISPLTTILLLSHHMAIMDATDGIARNFGCNNKEKIVGLLDTAYGYLISPPPSSFF